MYIETYAFDVYGTLIDTNGVLVQLRKILGDQAESVSELWRNKQLEYTFRRGLMQQYVPFPKVTEEALDYALTAHQIRLAMEERQTLVNSYKTLPAFPDALAAIERLARGQESIYAFSNGPEVAVRSLLQRSGLVSYFDGVVSVEATEVFKPSPVVYQHFAQTAQTAIAACALVSGNPFDVLGAKAAGMQGIWVQRDSSKVFDPWGITPDRVVRSLEELG